MGAQATALVGATGGAGTTRLCIELGALFAAEGESVVVLDAAYATQGLADHVRGRIETDVTALVTDGRPLADGLATLPTAGDGTVELAPARAPFERVARAKAPAAAREFESLVRAARDRADRVLVDVPPVAANQAVAAVDVADRIALVAPGTTRGADGLARMRDRLADLDVDVDAAVATCTDAASFADATVPGDATPPGETPVADDGDGAFTAGVAAVAETACDRAVDRTFDDGILSL
jgi:septum site-determining protein MinD